MFLMFDCAALQMATHMSFFILRYNKSGFVVFYHSVYYQAVFVSVFPLFSTEHTRIVLLITSAVCVLGN